MLSREIVYGLVFLLLLLVGVGYIKGGTIGAGVALAAFLVAIIYEFDTGEKTKRVLRSLPYKFVGKFSEISLFNISLAMLVLIIHYRYLIIPFIFDFMKSLSEDVLALVVFIPIAVILTWLFGMSLYYSIYYGLSKKSVSSAPKPVKDTLGLFALSCTAALSFASALFILIDYVRSGISSLPILAFPSYSLAKASAMFALIRTDAIEGWRIIDGRNAKLFEIAICAATLIGSFIILQYYITLVTFLGRTIINLSIALGLAQVVESIFVKFGGKKELSKSQTEKACY